jgi:hypothetical protein
MGEVLSAKDLVASGLRVLIDVDVGMLGRRFNRSYGGIFDTGVRA